MLKLKLKIHELRKVLFVNLSVINQITADWYKDNAVAVKFGKWVIRKAKNLRVNTLKINLYL